MATIYHYHSRVKIQPYINNKMNSHKLVVTCNYEQGCVVTCHIGTVPLTEKIQQTFTNVLTTTLTRENLISLLQ
jgi:hypothetical protein